MIEDELPEFAVGLLSPRVGAAELADRLRAVPRDAREIAANIAGNRCVLVADRFLARAADDDLLARVRTELAPVLELATTRVGQIERTSQLLDELSGRGGIPIWGIKGLASRAAYPEPNLRQLSDADITVEHQEQAFCLADMLRRRGFITDQYELPWIKADLGGTPYGQYRLLGPPGFLSVDIHFGPGYSTGHCGLMSIPMPRELGLHPLPVVANLAPMLGNSGGDTHITAKDVNDLWVASGHLSEETTDALAASARDVGFLEHLCEIARVTLEVTRLEPASEAILHRLAAADGGRPGRRILASRNRPVSRGVRAARTARAAFRQARVLTGSRTRAAGISLAALGYYGAPLKVRVVPLSARPCVPAPWRCVRLVPVGLAESPTQRWPGDAIPDEAATDPPTGLVERVEVDGGQLLRHGRSVFVPTVWYLISARLLRAAARLEHA
jgi:hypothetical protein